MRIAEKFYLTRGEYTSFREVPDRCFLVYVKVWQKYMSEFLYTRISFDLILENFNE